MLSWVMFINAALASSKRSALNDQLRELTAEEAFVHGACLVFVDGIGSGNTAFSRHRSAETIKQKCISYLRKQVGLDEVQTANDVYTNTEQLFGIHPFYIDKGI